MLSIPFNNRVVTIKEPKTKTLNAKMLTSLANKFSDVVAYGHKTETVEQGLNQLFDMEEEDILEALKAVPKIEEEFVGNRKNVQYIVNTEVHARVKRFLEDKEKIGVRELITLIQYITIRSEENGGIAD